MAGHGHGCALNKKKVGHLLMLQRGTDGWIGAGWKKGKEAKARPSEEEF